jgi:SAM-dependent methyltransferase
MINFFEQYPDFVDLDSRKNRGVSQVTFETLDNRHAVMAPAGLISNKTVLDLGSCLAATGHWCLAHGASHYTGVEIQPEMIKNSEHLMSKYWETDKFLIVGQDIRDFLDDCIKVEKKFDIVFMIGSIYAFLDTYGVLKKLSEVAAETIVIDSIYPLFMSSPDISIVQITRDQHINGSTGTSVFSGAGARPSPAAMRIMMESLGFRDHQGLIFPDPLVDNTVHDSYTTVLRRPPGLASLPVRYLLRFTKNSATNIKQVGDMVKLNIPSQSESMLDKPKMPSIDIWKFDDKVADRFQDEANAHIPDYTRVIDLCVDYTKIVHKNNKDIKIIDVGSALGYTIDKFKQSGYKNVFGVDNSPSMQSKSLHSESVIISDSLPTGPWDCVIANWTLHFIKERESYLRSMFEQLSPSGLVIISDKMTHSVETENLYHNFKRNNGVSEEIIQSKKLSLVGILTCMPLTWYLETMHKIGFVDIQVINTRYMFSTIYAKKL